MARRKRSRYSVRRSYRRRGGGWLNKAKYYDAVRNRANLLATDANAYKLFTKGSEESITKWGPSYKFANATQRSNRKKYGYFGRGDYKKYLKYIPRGLGAAYGGLSGFYGSGGSMYSAAVGAGDGWDEGARLSELMGLGDYGPVTSNQLIGGNDVPSVNETSRSGDIMWSNTEFVQNITASVVAPGVSAFQSTVLQLNPGLGETFPFLSQLAANFELYEFVGLMFTYKPTSGEYGNNSSNSIGKVVMVTNYDPTALPFTNSVEMENYDYANSSKPSCGMIHGVETNNKQHFGGSMKYVRTGQSTKSLLFTDPGYFQIATEGIPFGTAGTALVGELWVSYGIRLSRAKLYNSLNQNVEFARAISSTTNQAGGPNLAACTIDPNGTLPISITGTYPNFIINLPRINVSKKYLFCYTSFKAGASQTGHAIIFAGQDGVALLSQIGNGGGSGTVFNYDTVFLQSPNALNGKILFQSPAIVVGTTWSWSFIITEIDPDASYPVVTPT